MENHHFGGEHTIALNRVIHMGSILLVTRKLSSKSGCQEGEMKRSLQVGPFSVADCDSLSVKALASGPVPFQSDTKVVTFAALNNCSLKKYLLCSLLVSLQNALAKG